MMPEPTSPAPTVAKKPASRRAGRVTQRVANVATKARDEAVRRSEDALHIAAETLDGNPLGAIASAIAVGAGAAALIPATRREIEALGPLAERLREAAGEAFKAARAAGIAELTTAGLTVAAASDGLGGVVGNLAKAASAAGTAAAGSVRKSRSAESDGSSPDMA